MMMVVACRILSCVQAVAMESGTSSASSKAGTSQRGPMLRLFTRKRFSAAVSAIAPRASQKSEACF